MQETLGYENLTFKKIEQTNNNNIKWQPKKAGDHIEGKYLRTEQGKGKGTGLTFHILQDTYGQEVSILGCTVINNTIATIAPGTIIQIMYQGEGITQTGNKYKKYEILLADTPAAPEPETIAANQLDRVQSDLEHIKNNIRGLDADELETAFAEITSIQNDLEALQAEAENNGTEQEAQTIQKLYDKAGMIKDAILKVSIEKAAPEPETVQTLNDKIDQSQTSLDSVN